MKPLIFLTCFVFVTTFASAQEAGADSCPVRLAYAGLVGLGKVHGVAEYQLVFAPDSGYDVGPFRVTMTATMIDGSREDFDVDGVLTDGSGRSPGSSQLSLYPFATQVASFRIDSTSDWKGSSTCSGITPYPVSVGPTTSIGFDDGSPSAWPLTGRGTIEIVDAVIAFGQQPDYRTGANPGRIPQVDGSLPAEQDIESPPIAMSGAAEGSSTVLVVIDQNGSVADASLYRSSGSRTFDQASVDAARKSKFTAAHLTKAMGGAPIVSAYLIIYTFNEMM